MSNTQYLRRGHVQFDGWNFTSRLVDLPTIIESHKSIDSKTFYKTADLCQMLICKEGEGWNDDEDESSPMKKKKDPNKVDRKYLWPHGIGPPLKNCRKRRFRKTLKKKYVEAPEIEKEVKRLLRVDNDAVSVKWEVITEEELNANKGGHWSLVIMVITFIMFVMLIMFIMFIMVTIKVARLGRRITQL